MNKIDIVLTTWLREKIARMCLDTLKQNTLFPYRLIVIDNGSNSDFQHWLMGIADIYVKMDRNYGLEYVKHLGMEFVESELFISTDNDILVPKPKEGKDWLSQLIELKEGNPEYASIALRPQVLVGSGDIFGDNPPEVKEFSHVPGYMRIMETKLVNELGAWKDKRELRGHEEYWISERIIKAGRKCGWASNIRCYHLFGEENWGYGGLEPEKHGHKPTWLPKDNQEEIRRDFL